MTIKKDWDNFSIGEAMDKFENSPRGKEIKTLAHDTAMEHMQELNNTGEVVASIDDDDQVYYSCYVGSHLYIMPSGKFYMSWTTNQTIKDTLEDSLFLEVYEDTLDKFGCWQESGEGDPLDWFVCCALGDKKTLP